MATLHVLDTFPAFERYWRSVDSSPLRIQIERWEHEYMAPWPELLEKQLRSYTEEGEDWKQIARTRVFPRLSENLPRIRAIHRKLKKSIPRSYERTRGVLKVDFPVQFVIYVGIGVGAGWATRYGGRAACLFGLENAVDGNSGSSRGSSSTVSHELAHLVHDDWREKAGLRGIALPRGPYWRLYEEGFATECERRIEGSRAFKHRTGELDWLPWCAAHRGWLAAKFLRDVAARRSMAPYFGSWYTIRGHVECGYYLGQEMIREWARTRSLKEVATLPEPVIRRWAKSTLRKFVAAVPS